MRAAIYYRYGKPEVIEIKEIDTPVPGPDEVLIKMYAVSVNPVDWKVVSGKLRMITGKNFPKFTGIEGAGIIEQTGEKVNGLSRGQRVFVGLDYHGGACAEYVCAGESKVLPLHDSLSFGEACTMAIAGLSALQGLRDKGLIREGMDVLVNGASGGVGTYAVQIAKVLGAQVTGLCSSGNFGLVRSLGADEIIDYRTGDFTKSDRKFDIIFDTIGNLKYLKVRKSLKRKGIYVNISPSLSMLLTSFMTRFLPGRKAKAFMLDPVRDQLKELMQLIVDKKIRVVIDREYGFEDTAGAFEYSATKRAKGKVVIKIRD
jgi:NADPH:quinone reductase-like Zn-dependent oxidoreductase